MFNTISPTYDRVNRILSFGIDIYWRRKVAMSLPLRENMRLLDCATGTGDQIFSLMERSENIGHAVGIDLASEMLRVGKMKLKEKPYAHAVELRQACMTDIPYPDNSFDSATISFGIRNVSDIPAALKEIFRVLTPGGRIIILEFSMPRNRAIKAAHLFYLRRFVPAVGGFFSQHKEAYAYLNSSIEEFPDASTVTKLLQEAQFVGVQFHPLTFGIVTLYQGDKR